MSSNPFTPTMPYMNGAGYSSGSGAAATSGGREGAFDVMRDMGREVGDDSLDRIRDLLFGDLRRSWEARLQTLETRLQMLEDKLDAVRHDHRTDSQEQLAALAQGIDDLGQYVRRLTRG